ncbi:MULTISPECIES: hypothetical protein [Xenorhabdus]|uniref:Uncharacterized protein n=1 Tax=Xenorhabdus ehlersii TaxID=290111 RepID=A0A2D0IZC3_9GAMM|nr:MULTISPECIES: hypothetical protein [Xenorhabdus]MBC8951170.1 hypothetical protein [Xenorhabdus sp. TS4]PHM27291.1 hypothetical protein Xehl_00286 [Xenorhabdus ehlersii]RKE87394.1 hypothetical protein BDE27_3736 [Xenorhabdus ehlersii]
MVSGKNARNHKMNIYNIFSYKLENFLNVRSCKKAFDGIFYIEDEKDLFLIAAKKSNGNAVTFTRWHDLISLKRLKKKLIEKGFNEGDCESIILILSRFSYLFQINNRERMNQDIFIFYYVLQLACCSGDHDHHIDDETKNFMFRFLLFELSMDYDSYTRFKIEEGDIFFYSHSGKKYKLSNVINFIYDTFQEEKNKELNLLLLIKEFQLGVIDLLTKPRDIEEVVKLNDYNLHLIDPSVFVKTYKVNYKKIVSSLVDVTNNWQSTSNLFISNMILMNYSYYILRDNSRNIMKLKRIIKDDKIFSDILTAIVKRKFHVKEEFLFKPELQKYIKKSTKNESFFYNIIYSQQ